MGKDIGELTADLQTCVSIFAQSVGALSEIQGMMAENEIRSYRGEVSAYNEAAFADVRRRYDIEKPWLTMGLGLQ